MEKSKDNLPQNGYFRSVKSWYATEDDTAEPNVMFGKYHDDGSTIGEIEMRWRMQDGKLVPQLRAYDDSWKVLGEIGNVLFRELAKHDNQFISEEDFVSILNRLGYKDLTMYKREEKLFVVRHDEKNEENLEQKNKIKR